MICNMCVIYRSSTIYFLTLAFVCFVTRQYFFFLYFFFLFFFVFFLVWGGGGGGEVDKQSMH